MTTQGPESDTAGTPDAKRKRVEVNPDIPLTISCVEAVQALARRNNAETRPRKRLRPIEFLNEAFYVLGLAAVKDHDKSVDTMTLFEEFITVHHLLPRSSTLSRVLYAWLGGGLEVQGLTLLRRLLSSRDELPVGVFSDCFDEKVATVTLRLVTSPALRTANALTEEERKGLVTLTISLVPREALRRRLFSPVLAFAREQADWDSASRLLHTAVEHGIELWDADYHEILQTIAAAEAATGTPEADTAAVRMARLEAVLNIMSEQHPVVGERNAALVQRMAGGRLGCAVADSGECSHCGQHLHSFDLSSADRAVLLADIEEKLVLPRVRGLSRYEPESTVTEAEMAKRLGEFAEFKANLTCLPYDTVIDGANVGYYGLSSWYGAAKREELLAAHAEKAAGTDSALPAHVLNSIPSQPPFPVDVSPKFSLIESMRAAAVRKGKQPLIILHARHLSRGGAENMDVLRKWREERAVLASPAFLNDDYCWLYAAIVRPDTLVISNDQMRDHHFSILSPRFFLRWRQRHRITYKAFYNEATRSASLSIRMPRCYSVWVQRAAAAAAVTAHHWHVPYMDSIPIIDQSTNRTVATSADVDLNKDGDDNCSAWVCTFST